MPIQDVERYPLTFGPSPVHPLDRLSAHLGGAQVWANGEDVSSGRAFGGNKTRKLEAGLATSAASRSGRRSARSGSPAGWRG